MKEFAITKDHFMKSDCYSSTKVCSRKGIQVHSVGCKGTNKDRWKSSWNAADRDVCAGYVIDMDGIWEVLPEGKRCWLSGSGKNGNANNTHLGFEICEPLTRLSTEKVTEDIYGKALFLCVYLCKKYGISASMVQDHAELHALKLASNHADVKHWWGVKGTPWEAYTMDRLRNDIAAELGEDTPVTAVYVQTRPTILKGSEGEYVVEAQTRLIELGYDLGKWGADGDFGNKTEAAVIAFQKDNQLTADGIIGPVTWGVLFPDGEAADETVEQAEETVEPEDIIELHWTIVATTTRMKKLIADNPDLTAVPQD